MPQFPPGQTLLIDADDTLWENNVYFERAIAAFISYLDHHEYSPAEVRKALNEVERETILTHGYGLPSFTQSPHLLRAAQPRPDL
jgi:putative hydrolase of the HAD superfamily